MTSINPARRNGFPRLERIKGVLLTPASEWARIDAEPATISGLYAGYVCILAGLAAAAKLVGVLVFGVGMFHVFHRPPVLRAVLEGVVEYGLALAAVYALARVIDALAPAFGGRRSRIQAFKLAAYAGTAGWVAGLLSLYPPLAPLGLLGSLYGVVLLYMGAPRLMKTSADKAVGYTAVTVAVALLFSVMIGVIVQLVGSGSTGVWARPDASGPSHPPGAVVDVAKLRAATQAIQAATRQMRAAQTGAPPPPGAVKALPLDSIKALMPVNLAGGLARNELATASRAVGGLATASVRAVYANGDARLNLSITDMASLGALASLGDALNIQSGKVTADSYKTIGEVDGRLTTEAFDRRTRTGAYSVVVAKRFVVEADGSGVAIDQLKAAARSVGFDRLEALAKAG
jgi:type II secretory pathway pseudopilin PulG